MSAGFLIFQMNFVCVHFLYFLQFTSMYFRLFHHLTRGTRGAREQQLGPLIDLGEKTL